MRSVRRKQTRFWFVAACVAVGVMLFTTRGWSQKEQQEPQPQQQFTEDVADVGKDSVVAARTETPPNIDGMLDDDCWKDATRLTTFRIVDPPGSGLLATEQTEVLVTSDKKALCLAFICHDSEPGKIAAHQAQYDGSMDLDDYVVVCLDTFRDKSRCYEFHVNPLGTRRDERWMDPRWNGPWQAAARIGDDGWTAEIAIPFSILTMPKGAKRFGFNCNRSVQRKKEWSVWKYTKNYSDYEFTYAALSGFEVGAVKRPDRYLGYAVGSRRFEEPKSTTGHMGFDWEHPLTSTSSAMLTLNPDWSQIESAHAGIDFTYVERWFPEVRPFFVESAPYLPDPEIFYPQRRIYKFDEGLKLTGTEGRFRFGVLGMLGVERFADVPEENDLAARLWYDFGPDTYLNASGVRSATDNCTHLEFVHKNRGRINVSSYADYYHQSSDDPGLGGSHISVSSSARTEDWYVETSYENIGNNIQPQLGYLARRGIRRLGVGGARYLNPKPGATWFETGQVSVYYTRALDHDGKLNYEQAAASLYVRQTPRLSFASGPALYRHPSPTGDPFSDVTYSAWASFFERGPTNGWMSATFGTIEESRYRNFSLGASARTADDRLAGSVGLEWTRWGRRNDRSLHGSEENAHQHGLWLTYRPAKNTWFSFGERWLKQGSDSASVFNAVLRKQFGVDHDLYIIYGDPQNPNETVNQVVVKYVMPFGDWGER